MATRLVTIESVRFVLLFVCLAAVLTFLIRLPVFDTNIILPYTKGIAYLVREGFSWVGVNVQAEGTTLRHQDLIIDIRRGCDGVVAMIILVSACFAFPASLRRRLRGFVLGLLLIFSLNLGRIFGLFALGLAGQMRLFFVVHTYVAQFVVIAGTMVFWVFWVGRRESLDG